MTSQTSFRLEPPTQVYDSYKAILNSDLITKKYLDTEKIIEIQTYLNQAQPSNADENMTRSIILFLYRKNPNNFIRFLVRSNLSHLILWTEAKCIVQHFGLNGVLYVKWNGQQYECHLHHNANDDTNTQNNTDSDPRVRVSSNWGDSNQSNEYTDRVYNFRGNGRGQNGNYKGKGRGQNGNYKGKGRGQNGNYNASSNNGLNMVYTPKDDEFPYIIPYMKRNITTTDTTNSLQTNDNEPESSQSV